MSALGVPDGPWRKARCPGCARWIGQRPKVGGFRAHKIGRKANDPICPGDAPGPNAEERVRAILDSWSSEERDAALRILSLRRRPA